MATNRLPVRRLIMAVVLSCFVILAGLTEWHSGETSKKQAALQRISLLTLAMRNVTESQQAFPEATVRSDDGMYASSWRLWLSEWLSRVGYCDEYNENQPWDSADNKSLGTKPLPGKHGEVRIWGPPTEFHSTQSSGPVPAEDTNFLLITGPDTAFPPGKRTRPSEITDGAENTLIMIEVLNTEIHWLEPRDFRIPADLDVENPGSLLARVRQQKVRPLVAFADGRIYSMDPQIDFDVLHGLCTIAGGEALDRDEFVRAGTLVREK